ncbi:organic hydroperoxide resistance protein [Segnochrobactrum spirostomi]|uniref:Organic hydroperoxide resistance protein n=1 Tax=Segnochrobactrum spirostomi TaxID=2608987 RepID=A0A6A7Y2X8_9HYPH|nr:organic hydroperoxide resistance protein [Segnochrobactrum spirostomi]MQT13464.1 organic hydroperoxide resistance protein [Segnochrobactrum spirostomi]
MSILYRTKATATGGRDGSAASEDGVLQVKLAIPKELGGPGGAATNPEQLFAAGYSACFLSAVKFVAGQQKVKVADNSTVTASVGVGPRDDGTGFGLEVALEIALPGLERAVAEDLVARAHVVCPYSHATRGNLDVRLTVA